MNKASWVIGIFGRYAIEELQYSWGTMCYSLIIKCFFQAFISPKTLIKLDRRKWNIWKPLIRYNDSYFAHFYKKARGSSASWSHISLCWLRMAHMLYLYNFLRTDITLKMGDILLFRNITSYAVSYHHSKTFGRHS